ncbi:MAG: excalibur calcium-binding domain-containing protein [Candidatus Nanoarchaeia archaeon]|nr:excalibur calcium-binding domain-containing protein [Candidatus Nanoarchaeia archaeon]
MKILDILLTLSILILLVGCSQPTNQQKTRDIQVINSNDDKSEQTPTSSLEEKCPNDGEIDQTPELSSEERCINAGGEWLYFSSGCADSCGSQRREDVVCTTAMTWGCECGGDKCWNGYGCEKTIPDKKGIVLKDLDKATEQNEDEDTIICNYNAYNCDYFDTHAEAQYVYEYCGGVNNDIHDLDRDNDGSACETLP